MLHFYVPIHHIIKKFDEKCMLKMYCLCVPPRFFTKILEVFKKQIRYRLIDGIWEHVVLLLFELFS